MAAVLLLAAAPALADSRIREVVAKDGQVHVIGGKIGRLVVLRFPRGTRISNIMAGDGAWGAEISADGTAVGLKPTAEAFSTNLAVMTNKGVHWFDMREGGPVTYELRLKAPSSAGMTPPNSRTPQPNPLRGGFTWSGDETLMPAAVWTDGKFTYLQFAPRQPIPSIAATAADGSATAVNWHQGSELGLIVVQTTAPKLILIAGQATGCIWAPGQ